MSTNTEASYQEVGQPDAIECPTLPEGCTWTNLSSIAKLKGGLTKGQKRKSEDILHSVPYLRVANVQRGFLDLSEIKEIEATEEEIRELRLSPGDILFNEGGDRDKLGRGWIWRSEIPECIHQNHVFRARLYIPNMQPKLISWYGNSFGQQYFVREGKQTTNLASLNLTKLGALPVPLPPINEQHRIVAEIETQFTRLDVSVAALQRVQANLKRYRASVLQAACEGRLVLTEAELARAEGRTYEPAGQLLQRILQERRAQWEADQLAKMQAKGKVPKDDRWKSKYKEPVEPDTSELPELPEGWVWTTVEQFASFGANSITDGPFGSNLKTSHYTSDGPRVVRLQNIGEGVFIDAYAHISQEHYESLTKHRIEGGDLVIAALGERPPRACIIPPSVGPAIVKADCIRFKPEPRLALAKFLNYTLNAEPTRARTASIVHGVGRPRLNLGEIKAVVLPLPPLAEQHRIVAEVERRLSVIDELEATIEANLKRADRLRQSILKRAFEGKLAPQDPTDEPASALLQRIRAERELAIEKPKKTRKTKPRKSKLPPKAVVPVQGELSLGFGE